MLFVLSMTTAPQKQSLTASEERIGFWSDFIFLCLLVMPYGTWSTGLHCTLCSHILCVYCACNMSESHATDFAPKLNS